MEKLVVVEGMRVVLERQYSKIGSECKRMFMEIKTENRVECYNWDFVVGHIFPMQTKDFEPWVKDAEVIPEDQTDFELVEFGVSPVSFTEAFKVLIKECADDVQ